jgi:hypothetical protein
MLPADFDVSKVHFGTPRTNDNGGKSIYLSFNKAPIVLQTPEMVAPFGKQKWENDKGVPKHTLDLSFKDKDKRDLLKTFFDKMTELDEKLVDSALENSFDWLKKKGVSRDVVKNLYTPLVRHPIDKATGEISTKYAPTFKLSLPFKDGAFTTEVYDGARKLVDLNAIETKGARVTAIIQCLGVWVAAGKFGCTWKVLQMKVVPPQAIKGYAFKEVENDVVDDEVDSDKEEDDDDEVEAPVVAKDDEEDDDVVESSDDELESKKPEPPKATGKKVNLKKK